MKEIFIYQVIVEGSYMECFTSFKKANEIALSFIPISIEYHVHKIGRITRYDYNVFGRSFHVDIIKFRLK